MRADRKAFVSGWRKQWLSQRGEGPRFFKSKASLPSRMLCSPTLHAFGLLQSVAKNAGYSPLPPLQKSLELFPDASSPGPDIVFFSCSASPSDADEVDSCIGVTANGFSVTGTLIEQNVPVVYEASICRRSYKKLGGKLCHEWVLLPLVRRRIIYSEP